MMKTMQRSTSSSSRAGNYHASYNRAQDWQSACAQVMGFDAWMGQESMEDSSALLAALPSANHHHKSLQVINLLSPDDHMMEQEEDGNTTSTENPVARDAWASSALSIQVDLERMAVWIRDKRSAFVAFDGMNDNEASLIQSTVTSFAATTASEIESLRQMTLTTAESEMQQQHRTGIVQILMARLKEEVVEPFGVLQKHRSRQAVALWQHPLHCRLLVRQKPKKRKRHDEIDQALGLDDDSEYDADPQKEQRFLPQRDQHALRQNFLDTYAKDEQLDATMKRPKSFVQSLVPQQQERQHSSAAVAHKNNESSSSNDDEPPTPKYSQPEEKVPYQLKPHPQALSMQELDMTPEEQAAHEQNLREETLVLTALANNELDSVQKLEQQMVSITTLLSQFSELVSEQQEEVWNIHDTTVEAKDNMEKGQENLVDAAERTQSSRHYTAKGIFSLGLLLLLFHWLRP